jgi:hypothetical protein
MKAQYVRVYLVFTAVNLQQSSFHLGEIFLGCFRYFGEMLARLELQREGFCSENFLCVFI